MKKGKQITAGLLCVVTMLILTGCGKCHHEWAEATCTEPKTCTKCGETEGEALGHDWGEWEIVKEATVTEEGMKEKTCARCKETKTESYETETYVSDGHLLLSPVDFCDRLTQKLYCQKATLRENGEEMAAAIKGVGGFDPSYEEGEAIAALFFADGDGNMLGSGEAENCSTRMLCAKFYTEDQGKIAKTMMGIIEACDGSLDTKEAGNIGKKVVQAFETGGAYSSNGINYGLTKMSGSYVFMVTFG